MAMGKKKRKHKRRRTWNNAEPYEYEIEAFFGSARDECRRISRGQFVKGRTI